MVTQLPKRGMSDKSPRTLNKSSPKNSIVDNINYGEQLEELLRHDVIKVALCKTSKHSQKLSPEKLFPHVLNRKSW